VNESDDSFIKKIIFSDLFDEQIEISYFKELYDYVKKVKKNLKINWKKYMKFFLL